MKVLGYFLVFAVHFDATLLNSLDCAVYDYADVAYALSACDVIRLKDFVVPGNATLHLNLKEGSTVYFEGELSFEFFEWEGPLVLVEGSNINIVGDGVLQGRGELYWDGEGSGGVKKPKFFTIQNTINAIFDKVNLVNCPRHCTTISNSENITILNWKVDVSLGDEKAANGHSAGANTDGFDISNATNVVIRNSTVRNQDDCVAVNEGANMHFSNLFCSGGHGLSLSVGFNGSSNIVKNVTFTDSVVENSRNGIHIKVHTDAGTGLIEDVRYSNIIVANAQKYGVNVEQNYHHSGASGTATSDIPIVNLRLTNVTGTATSESVVPVYILCGSTGCKNWDWSDVNITGGTLSVCNYLPAGFSC
ncbi:polygalacturonase-like isoform X2 [Cylas formicarius]|uniref:polygalacturonase-like isoform X2 n=1 Tax=Cylas formicarius TaxID=197179 RepID=UPI002958D255|nr:polygalacturonase-like isoform X2 [Cylas formicarius]